MRPPVPIIFAADDYYTLPLAVALSSTLRHLPLEMDVLVLLLSNGISASNRERIEQVTDQARPSTQLRWVEVDELPAFDGAALKYTGSKATYARLLIPHLVPPECELALYLDSDILVRADVYQMVPDRIGSEDVIVWAVSDFHHETIGSAMGTGQVSRLDLDPATQYFNSGIMLINVRKWRESMIYEHTLEFAKENAGVIVNDDQDALNATVGNRWSPLDPTWNVMVQSTRRFARKTQPNGASAYRRHLLNNAQVLHFTGRRKPWNPGYGRFGRSEYLAALAQSGWFESADQFRRWRRSRRARSPYWYLRYTYRRLRNRVARTLRTTSSQP